MKTVETMTAGKTEPQVHAEEPTSEKR